MNKKIIHRNLFTYLLLCIVSVISLPNCRCQNSGDTVFLYKSASSDNYRAVFFDSKQSIFHKKVIESISIADDDYNSVLQQLRDLGFKSDQHFRISFPCEWYSVHQYQQKYYAYYPSEPYVNSFIKFNDSTITLNYFNDGCIPAFIKAVSFVNKKTLKISISTLYEEDSTILIHFLNTAKSLAVIEFPSRVYSRRYQLIASKNKFMRLPIIVNYCPSERCPEWQFEVPEFQQLLNK